MMGLVMIRSGQVESKVATREAKKRWAAPEVTRLEFPKTAALSISGLSVDATYGSNHHS
jgi:hypothetical protein